MKTILLITALILLGGFAGNAQTPKSSLIIASMVANGMGFTGKTYMAAAPNDGTYTRTGSSVSIYTESGHSKGTFAVYLHHGKRYIDFNNTWICIQGKSRFGYRGNWYVIK